MKHVYIIQRARGRRRSDIDIDTDIDISYMRGDFGEVPVPIISVDVHLGYPSLISGSVFSFSEIHDFSHMCFWLPTNISFTNSGG